MVNRMIQGVRVGVVAMILAAGNCLYAIDQLFVADMENALYLAPGVPSGWKDYAFRLPAPGGLMIDMAVKGGRAERLTITCAHPSAARKVRIVPPAGIGLAAQTIVLDRPTIVVKSSN